MEDLDPVLVPRGPKISGSKLSSQITVLSSLIADFLDTQIAVIPYPMENIHPFCCYPSNQVAVLSPQVSVLSTQVAVLSTQDPGGCFIHSKNPLGLLSISSTTINRKTWFVFSWFSEPNLSFLLAGWVPSERYWRAAHPQVRLPQEAQDSEEQPSVQEEVFRTSRYWDTDFIKLFRFFYPGCPPFSIPSFSSLATEKKPFFLFDWSEGNWS